MYVAELTFRKIKGKKSNQKEIFSSLECFLGGIERYGFAYSDLGQIFSSKESYVIIVNIPEKNSIQQAKNYIHLKNDFGLDDNRILQISLTREELANIVGTATESVIRLLSEFKQDHLIELNGRKIKILDEPGLIRIGNLYE